mgnify:CR=1 FL=1
MMKIILLVTKLINRAIYQKLKLFLFFVLFLFISIKAHAECDFIDSKFIEELNNPSSINKITIEIPKSGKYNRNFVQTLVSNSKNIPSKLKKKFSAKIKVLYSFGSCTFGATVKQTGDWRDHIGFTDGGKPIRSLNVKLNQGNILNIVRFKLLIPKTRNNLHEILGSVLLRELGYIAPETFQVKTEINGVNSLMLFQEDARKELLENNKRREGPLFEGDENILWSFQEFENFELIHLSLSRMINDEWFLKGKNSQKIALSSFSRLQEAYLKSSKLKSHIFFNPNENDNYLFHDYAIAILSMNGEHGLHNANRRFYFNSFIQDFEPIYYDGNLDLLDRTSIKDSMLQINLSKDFSENYIKKLSLSNWSNDVFLKFFKRVVISESSAYKFYIQSIENIQRNEEIIVSKIRNSKIIKTNKKDLDEFIRIYISDQSKYNFEQIILSKIDLNKNMSMQNNGVSMITSIMDISELISDNKINGKRAVYIPSNSYNYTDKHERLQNISSNIITSKDMKFSIDENNKIMTFEQSQNNDWVLINDFNFSNWKIIFNGINHVQDTKESTKQNFNYYGMTGCLNFYKVEFDKTNISSSGGNCEDNLNIFDSVGNINNIRVNDSFSDGVDIDFSNIIINNIVINDAGNDCFDVSGGAYEINNLSAVKCGDKGVSIGEKSVINIENLNVNQAVSAISSKDMSISNINTGNFSNVENCYEAFQKKQEFGGSLISFAFLDCSASKFVDKNSLMIQSQ